MAVVASAVAAPYLGVVVCEKIKTVMMVYQNSLLPPLPVRVPLEPLELKVGDRTRFDSVVHGTHFGTVRSVTPYREGYAYEVQHDSGALGVFHCEGARNNNEGLRRA